MDWVDQLERYRNDPWAWAVDCVFTQDQIDKANPIKAFPSNFEYLHLYFDLWMKERLIAVPKSRRMFLSWASIILYVHDTIFNLGRHNAFVSKKEDDANELVLKAKFIVDNLNKDKMPREMIPKSRYKYCMLEFPEIDSKIQGFPQGADQLRQFTLSGLLADEMAFWEKAKESYSASFPTLEGGGRMTAISSAAPGFFKDIVFDNLDGVEGLHEKIDSPFMKRYPMDGVEVWKNPKNKFSVFQLHYTAAPHKREGTYRDTMKASMPIRQFMQEFEIQWESYAGNPVYADWSEKYHGTEEKIYPEVGLPLFIGFDWGLTPAALVCQLQGDTLVCLKEYTATNMGAKRFLEMISPKLYQDFPNWHDRDRQWICCVDPSGFFRKDTDEGTCVQVLKDFGFTTPIGGDIPFESRRQSVEYFLATARKGKPKLQVCLPLCPMLTRGFNGGYMYSDKSFEVEPNKIRPVKNEFSHIHDALQMITSGMHRAKVKKRRGQIPRLSYTFS